MLPFTSAQTLRAEATPTPVNPIPDEDQAPESAGFEGALDVAASEDDLPLNSEPDVYVVPTSEPAPTPAPGQPQIYVAPSFTMPPATTDEPSSPTMDTTDAVVSSATPAKVRLTATDEGSHATATAAQTVSTTSAETTHPASTVDPGAPKEILEATPQSAGGGASKEIPEPAPQSAGGGASKEIPEAAPQSAGGAPSKETVTATQGTATRPTATDLPSEQDQASRPRPVAQTQAPGTRMADSTPEPAASGTTTNNASATPETGAQSTPRDRDNGEAERQPTQAKPIDRPRAPATAAPITSGETTKNNVVTETPVPTTTQTGNNISVATPTTDAMTVAPSEAAPAVAAQPITSAGATPTQQTRPLEIPDVSDLLEQVRVRLSPKRPEITVLLDPPELGRLFIKLAMKGGELAATVTVDNARVARLFEGDVGRLYRTLDEAGIRVVEVEIRTALDSSDDPENPWDEQRDGAGSEFGPDDRADVPHTRDVRGTSRSHQDSAQPSRTVAKSRASTLDLMI